MDKDYALKIGRNYVAKLKNHNINVLNAWLFGSYAKGNYNVDSDIDIALILPTNLISFDTDVKLMALRKGEETLLEIHTYSQNDFSKNMPITNQIKQYGMKL